MKKNENIEKNLHTLKKNVCCNIATTAIFFVKADKATIKMDLADPPSIAEPALSQQTWLIKRLSIIFVCLSWSFAIACLVSNLRVLHCIFLHD
jgi:hypothetical protein